MDIQLPEIVASGIYNTRIFAGSKTVTKNRKTTMFEIELPLEKGGISNINSEAMPIDTNMIICAKPGQLRHTKLPYKCRYIHIIIKSGSLYDMLLCTPNFIKTNRYSEYYDIFSKICYYADTNLSSDELMLQSLILRLIHTITEDSNRLKIREHTKNSNYKTVEKVVSYIQNNLTFDLSLEKTADYAGFSPIHFHNLFKASTGKTLREYVEEQRIKKAVNMLLSTDKTLTEIAHECGFSSQSYFSYAFKRRMKTTPREYVKKIHSRYES